MTGSTQPEPGPERGEVPVAGPASSEPASSQPTSSNGSSTAVWYFVGATFLFAGPLIFGVNDFGFFRIITLVLGAVVMVAGFVVLRRETTKRS
ncbi:hypothetical protein [Plantibacter sp. LMC-P-059a]|jgi:hypothetical protein|uniref:hypothetical protein n=1 Tax=Plantibacter sp. LMC-P-059a TaxID=3040297 RepID=UPI00254CAB7F|nr:hypothetical protein [Plantibacter sp. LMC-P-059a]